MEERKSWVNRQGVSSIKCPNCGLTKKSAVGAFKEIRHTLSIHCSCGKAFQTLLDFRKAHRKQVDLTGFFSFQAAKKSWNYMFVLDLSLSGIGFKTVNGCTLQSGDTVKLMFTLDDTQATVVEKEAVVIHKNEKRVGCEFADPRIMDDILGRYLVPDQV